MRKILLNIVLLIAPLVIVGQEDMDLRIVKSEFLYENAPFLSCHASTIVETNAGDLLVAYFGGDYEGSDNVCIWLSRKENGKNGWNNPIKIADGEPNSELNERKACYNPVLFKMPNGDIVLFFKIGKNVQDWSGWYSVSYDEGYTWSEKKMLPTGFLGPIKNKPELIANKLICPSSTEKDWWRIHFEIYDLDKKTWKYVGPIKAKKAVSSMNMRKDSSKKSRFFRKHSNEKREPIICIQPSILKLPDGRLQVLCRTKNSSLATSYSSDNGEHWSKVRLTSLPNNNSGTDAVTLFNGQHVLVYNDVRSQAGEEMGKRSPLVIALFDKDMKAIQKKIVLEDDPEGEYSYPAVIQGRNGNIYVTYTWKRQRIAFKEIEF